MSRITVHTKQGDLKVGPATWEPTTFSVPMVTPTGTGMLSRISTPVRRLHGNCIVPEGLQPGQKA